MSPMHMGMHHTILKDLNKGSNTTESTEPSGFSIIDMLIPKGNVSIFYSWDTYRDGLAFYGVFALICYTIGIFLMVSYLIYI